MIYKKLLEFQKLGISIKKNNVNLHFKNEYADLNEVLDKVKKPLNDLGVLIKQVPAIETIPGTPPLCVHGLRTTLYDTEDDTWIDSFVPFVGASDMQKLGGAITYAKRYSLVAMLALEDDDDDGNKASAKNKVTKTNNDDEPPF